MGTLTDVAPAWLVPAAWLVTIAAHVTSLVTERTLLIALVVMDALLVAFLVAAADEMDGPVLGVWRGVLAGGLAVTLAGTAGLALDPDQPALTALALYGWMVLPGLAYARTAGKTAATPDDSRVAVLPVRTSSAPSLRSGALARYVYVAAAGASLGGAAIYAVGHLGGFEPPVTTFVGLCVVGIGQTAGIVTAAYRNVGARRPDTAYAP